MARRQPNTPNRSEVRPDGVSAGQLESQVGKGALELGQFGLQEVGRHFVGEGAAVDAVVRVDGLDAIRSDRRGG